ncbi:MAG TPA: primase alpha helix C-terminal domain-containing protein, partial [Candidatus Koribacter sp.]
MTLTKLAGTMRRTGMSRQAIEAALLAENAQRCQPPLPESEVREIAQSVSRYAASTVSQTRSQSTVARSIGIAPDQLADALERTFRFVLRYVKLSEAQAEIIVLWIAHTHALSAAQSSPYVAITSAEKQCGKTRLLEVLNLLVVNPWLTGRVTAACLTRKIDKDQPTLLLDESDAAFNGEKEYAEALRGVLNTGHRRGGKASCCVGKGADTKDFQTFCPKAIAGIGHLPDTVADRSIPILLKRK